jgi:hypothetical protein
MLFLYLFIYYTSVESFTGFAFVHLQNNYFTYGEIEYAAEILTFTQNTDSSSFCKGSWAGYTTAGYCPNANYVKRMSVYYHLYHNRIKLESGLKLLLLT